MEVKDNVVIITGASSGIGLATAKLFAKNKSKVVLVARSKEKLDKLAVTLPNSLAIVCDMTNPHQIKKMIKKVLSNFGKIDVLINNAGQGYNSLLEEIELPKLRHIFDLDFVGPILAMQEVIPQMRKQGQGAIVNLSSGTTRMYLPGMSPYSSIKTALNVASHTSRLELAEDNIRVSLVYPYMTATDFEKNTLKSPRLSQSASENKDFGDLPPVDSPEKVAKMILKAVKTGKPEVFANPYLEKGELQV